MRRRYLTVDRIKGPLIFVKRVKDVGYGEIVKIETPQGKIQKGQVLEIDENIGVVQAFGGTFGLGIGNTKIEFTGETFKLGVSSDILGRVFSGVAEPLDGYPDVVPDQILDVNGFPINPVAREHPNEFIQTGISAIDGLNTLVRGQKLPIFSGSGLPHSELAAQIARQATVVGREEFVVVFAAMGITHEEASFFRKELEKSGAIARSVLFLNLSSDPPIERLVTPRIALTTAEYLAFEKGLHVLVILTDMTNYCEALREIAGARDEVPSRRGYPGYMYTDLATIYERAGRLKGKKGSITQLPIITMPGDDITHPIPDLSGYITEGQIRLSRDLYKKGIYPPIDVLPSLSRLMHKGIGKGKTGKNHKKMADKLYAAYADGREFRDLAAIIGRESLTEEERKYVEFSDAFEDRFVNQGKDENRSIKQTLDIGLDVLSVVGESIA